MSDDIEAVLRLADLPRPSGEQHEMEPPHHLCLGDDPCICIHLAACEQRVRQETADRATIHLALHGWHPDDPAWVQRFRAAL